MRVLIVDDETAARERLARMLAELDVECAGEAESGVRALEQVQALRPTLLLLDIAMPEVDGFDVARHLPEPRPLIVFQTWSWRCPGRSSRVSTMEARCPQTALPKFQRTRFLEYQIVREGEFQATVYEVSAPRLERLDPQRP